MKKVELTLENIRRRYSFQSFSEAKYILNLCKKLKKSNLWLTAPKGATPVN